MAVAPLKSTQWVRRGFVDYTGDTGITPQLQFIRENARRVIGGAFPTRIAYIKGGPHSPLFLSYNSLTDDNVSGASAGPGSEWQNYVDLAALGTIPSVDYPYYTYATDYWITSGLSDVDGSTGPITSGNPLEVSSGDPVVVYYSNKSRQLVNLGNADTRGIIRDWTSDYVDTAGADGFFGDNCWDYPFNYGSASGSPMEVNEVTDLQGSTVALNSQEFRNAWKANLTAFAALWLGDTGKLIAYNSGWLGCGADRVLEFNYVDPPRMYWNYKSIRDAIDESDGTNNKGFGNLYILKSLGLTADDTRGYTGQHHLTSGFASMALIQAKTDNAFFHLGPYNDELALWATYNYARLGFIDMEPTGVKGTYPQEMIDDPVGNPGDPFRMWYEVFDDRWLAVVCMRRGWLDEGPDSAVPQDIPNLIRGEVTVLPEFTFPTGTWQELDYNANLIGSTYVLDDTKELYPGIGYIFYNTDYGNITTNPPPQIYTIDPSYGYQGDTATINLQGAGFVEPLTVAIDTTGVTLNSTTVNSITDIDLDITVDAVAPTGYYDVSIETADGTGIVVGGFETRAPATEITIVRHTPEKAHRFTNAGGIETTTVKLEGIGFDPTLTANSVYYDNAMDPFSGAPLTFYENSTVLNYYMYIGQNVSGYGFFAEVEVRGASATGTLADAIEIYPEVTGLPVYGAITPSSVVPGQTIDIYLTGENFRLEGTASFEMGGDPTGVAVGGLTLRHPRHDLDTATAWNTPPTGVTITITADPDGPEGIRDLVYTTREGSFTASGVLNVATTTDPPVIDYIYPNITYRGYSDEVIQIRGTNFGESPDISFSDSDLSVTNIIAVDDSTILLTYDLDAGTSLGTKDITVTTANGSATLEDNLLVRDNAWISTTNLYPNGRGSFTQLFRTGDTANWRCVDETSADDDTTYVYLSSTGESVGIDTYSIGFVPSSYSGRIKSVTVHARAKREAFAAGGKADMYIITRTNSVQYTSDVIETAAGWNDYSQSYTLNPNTGLLWTWDEIDQLRIGVFLDIAGDGVDPSEVRVTQMYVSVEYDFLFSVIDNYSSIQIVPLDATRIYGSTSYEYLVPTGVGTFAGGDWTGSPSATLWENVDDVQYTDGSGTYISITYGS